MIKIYGVCNLAFVVLYRVYLVLSEAKNMEYSWNNSLTTPLIQPMIIVKLTEVYLGPIESQQCFIVTVVDIDDNGGNDHGKHKLWSI